MPRLGFTLIECLCAIIVFTIGILASTLFVVHQMRLQETTHARAVAGGAAMLLGDWHVSHHVGNPGATFEDSCVGAGKPLMATPIPLAQLTWRGGDQPQDDVHYLFNDTATAPASGTTLHLVAPEAATVRPTVANPSGVVLPGYRRIVVGLSPVTAAEPDSGLRFRQLTLWAGNRAELLAGRATTLQFLGRFVCAER